MNEHLWELVCHAECKSTKTGLSTERMKVFGGWKLRTVTHDLKRCNSESSIFVPDPKHEWVIE